MLINQFLFAKPRVETEASISIVYLSSNKWVRPNCQCQCEVQVFTMKVCDEGTFAGDMRKVLIIVFAVLIILANSLLIFLIAKDEKLRKKVTQ